MGFQSKTYSLSDEVVAAIEAARAAGETPNQLLTRLLVNPVLHKATPRGLDDSPEVQCRIAETNATATRQADALPADYTVEPDHD